MLFDVGVTQKIDKAKFGCIQLYLQSKVEIQMQIKTFFRLESCFNASPHEMCFK